LKTTEEINDVVFALARSNPILAALSSDEITKLIEGGERVDFAAQDALVRQGERGNCAYLILEGDLEVLVRTAYSEVLIARLSHGALIGEIGVFADLPRNATVLARSGVSALRLDRRHLIEAGCANPALLRSVISRLGTMISRFNSAIGLYTNAVAALEQDNFDISILDELKQPSPELADFAEHFRRMAEQIVERRARQAEMASAAAIQRAMLPNTQPANLVQGAFDLFTHMIPAREVGGDLYDVVELGENRVVISIGDVCGKGVPAALFMAVTQTVMRLLVRSGEHLQAEIAAANDLLVANNRESMFATLFCGVIDVASGTMTYCNCGHNPPLVLRKGADNFESLGACGPPLGLIDSVTYTPRSVGFAPGDVLLLYTDGVIEAENSGFVQFGARRLEQAIVEMRGQSARSVVEHVVGRVAEFTAGAPQSDDITCIALVRQER
jgi:phosphoserine phosphatase RsbU/P